MKLKEETCGGINCKSERWLAREIVLIGCSGYRRLHTLSIVDIDNQGKLTVVPFSTELPGVIYSDTPLYFKEIKPDCWERILFLQE